MGWYKAARLVKATASERERPVCSRVALFTVQVDPGGKLCVKVAMALSRRGVSLDAIDAGLFCQALLKFNSARLTRNEKERITRTKGCFLADLFSFGPHPSTGCPSYW